MQQLLPKPIGEAGAQLFPTDRDLRLRQSTEQDQTHQQSKTASNWEIGQPGACFSGRWARSQQQCDR